MSGFSASSLARLAETVQSVPGPDRAEAREKNRDGGGGDVRPATVMPAGAISIKAVIYTHVAGCLSSPQRRSGCARSQDFIK